MEFDSQMLSAEQSSRCILVLLWMKGDEDCNRTGAVNGVECDHGAARAVAGVEVNAGILQVQDLLHLVDQHLRGDVLCANFHIENRGAFRYKSVDTDVSMLRLVSHFHIILRELSVALLLVGGALPMIHRDVECDASFTAATAAFIL